jgi:PTH1 family peptidyl-tRNA hydrolase
MKLIVGLGNPGEKYKLNRHNVGFMFVEYLAKGLLFKYDKYLLSEVVKTEEFIYAKPQTYMNKSGDSVKKLLGKYIANDQRPMTNDLIVVHDDLDIPFGKFKIQLQGPKAHNGLTDIQDKLRTMDFLRVRIGVDNRPAENRMNGEEYVLQNFSSEEFSLLLELFKNIETRLMANLSTAPIQ